MYSHNHRPPGVATRLPEILDTLKVECETLAADAALYKHRAEDAERKLQLQLQEMSSIQGQIIELERTFQKMKTVYESEIMQLRRQLEALGASPVTLESQASRSAPAFPTPSISHSGPSSVVSSSAAPVQLNPNLLSVAPGVSASKPGAVAPALGKASPAPGAPSPASINTTVTSNMPPTSITARFPADLAAVGMLQGGPTKMPPAMSPLSATAIGPLGNPAAAAAAAAMMAPSGYPHVMESMMYGGLMRQYDPHMAAAAAAVAASLPTSVMKGAQPNLPPPLGNPGVVSVAPLVPNSSNLGVGSAGLDPSLIAAAANPSTYGSKPVLSKSSSNNNTSTAMDVDSPVQSGPKTPQQTPDSTSAGLQTTTATSAEWNLTLNTNVKKHLDINLLHDLDHNSVVCCVKFSANGKFLATGCKQSAQLYDVETGQKVQTFKEADPNNPNQGDPYIRSVCFSPDNMTLATGAEDRTIKLWDVQSGTIKHNLQGHSLDIYSVDFSRDGRLIVSGSGDRHVKVWDAESGRLLHNLGADDVGPKDGVTSVAFSPDGRFVAAGSLDRVVRIWDVQTGYFIDRFEGHQDSVYSVAFDPEGKTVASGSLDKTLRLWDVSSRSRSRCRHTFVGHKDFVLSVAFSPDGSWIASGSKDRFVHFWDPRSANLLMTLHGHKNSVISVAVCASPADSSKGWFATGSGDHRGRIWSYSTLSQQLSASSASHPAQPATSSPSSSSPAASSAPATPNTSAHQSVKTE